MATKVKVKVFYYCMAITQYDCMYQSIQEIGRCNNIIPNLRGRPSCFMVLCAIFR